MGESYIDIPTKGAYDWESFQIGSDTYLAVANYFDGSNYALNSVIYKWDGSTFVSHQTIALKGAYDWESFQIGSDTYLAVANYFDDSSHATNSVIYKLKLPRLTCPATQCFQNISSGLNQTMFNLHEILAYETNALKAEVNSSKAETNALEAEVQA